MKSRTGGEVACRTIEITVVIPRDTRSYTIPTLLSGPRAARSRWRQREQHVKAVPVGGGEEIGLGQLTVDWRGRWVLVSVTDQWESEIMVADSFR
jgi:hypothetical protein